MSVGEKLFGNLVKWISCHSAKTVLARHGGRGAFRTVVCRAMTPQTTSLAHELRADRLQQAYFQLKGLILAQNERWRRGLGMQVVREGASHFGLSARLSWQDASGSGDSLK